MRRWERPYTLDAATGAAMLGLISMIGLSVVVGVAYGRSRLPLSWAVLFGMCLAGGFVVACRRAMLGVYVSDQGIRSRSLLRTTTVRWECVTGIRSRPATMAGLDMGRDAIFVERADGPPVQTPLQRGDFLRPFTFRPELGRLATWPEHYDEIMTILRARHDDARHRRHHQPPGGLASPDGLAPPAAEAVPAGPWHAPAPRPDRPPLSGPAHPPPPGGNSHLYTLARLHQRGVLTDAEYATELAKHHNN